MKKQILIVFFVLLAWSVLAQQSYPIHIPKGQSKTLQATDFDLWVLKDSQFNRALSDSKELKLIKEQVEELKKSIDLHEEKEKELQKLADTYKKDRDYYQTNWKKCDKDIQQVGSAYKRQKIIARVSLIAVPVAFIGGLLIR